MKIQLNNLNKFYFYMIFITFSSLIIFSEISLSDFRSTHYVFSFQDGLYVRALLGSLSRIIFPGFFGNQLFIYGFQLAILYALVFLIIELSYRFFNKNRNIVSFSIILLFFSMPFGISFFAKDFGRLDQVNYLLALLLILYFPKLNHFLKITLMLLIFPIMIMIHEVSLLLIIPAVVYYYIYLEIDYLDSIKNIFAKVIIPLMISLLPTLMLFLFIFTEFKLDYSDYNLAELTLQLNSLTDFEISQGALLPQFYSVEQNILYSFSYYQKIGRLYSILVSTIISIPYIFISIKFLNYQLFEKSGNKKLIYIMLVLLFSPLLISFVALDVPRWISAVVFNAFVLVMAGSTYNQKLLITFKDININETLIVFLIVFSLIVGPVSATRAPYLFGVLYQIIIEFTTVIF